ncbi:hypothetical protein BDQ12DRAFT_727774 [Crucibulum laeve]|uniref:Uncharacterized protein n=1 Tax=Crucibulum laeve TaxID=68775 RepID=A0A5C3LL76_9AGAR|nr:hypothetical protein BDQ12DRAFT_727774 [Crucibulum laeve]
MYTKPARGSTSLPYALDNSEDMGNVKLSMPNTRCGDNSTSHSRHPLQRNSAKKWKASTLKNVAGDIARALQFPVAPLFASKRGGKYDAPRPPKVVIIPSLDEEIRGPAVYDSSYDSSLPSSASSTTSFGFSDASCETADTSFSSEASPIERIVLSPESCLFDWPETSSRLESFMESNDNGVWERLLGIPDFDVTLERNQERLCRRINDFMRMSSSCTALYGAQNASTTDLSEQTYQHRRSIPRPRAISHSNVVNPLHVAKRRFSRSQSSLIRPSNPEPRHYSDAQDVYIVQNELAILRTKLEDEEDEYTRSVFSRKSTWSTIRSSTPAELLYNQDCETISELHKSIIFPGTPILQNESPTLHGLAYNDGRDSVISRLGHDILGWLADGDKTVDNSTEQWCDILSLDDYAQG